LDKKNDVWLLTVIETYGSSPRPVGSLMAFSSSHGQVGSLSGGCIEADLIAQISSGELLLEYKRRTSPMVIRFGESEAEQSRLKLPCGGTMTILVEYFDGHGLEDLAHFTDLSLALERRQYINRSVNLQDGRLSHQVQTERPYRNHLSYIPDLVLTHRLGPAWKLLIIGATDVARYVAELALMLDFDVCVCDSRKDFSQAWAVEGVPLSCSFPDDLIREKYSDERSAIVAVAHDPRLDDMALMEALGTKAFYVGAMGSAATSAGRRQRLAQLEQKPADIARLKAPIGLDIKSKTPAEIAVSILAELIQQRSLQL